LLLIRILYGVANGAGLIRYNKKTGEQKIFTESDGLLGNETRQVLKYKDELWITSQSRGISILNTKK
jgi:ligand-binding sensor domain-containing protein